MGQKKKHILLSGNNAWGMYNFRSVLMRHLVERGFRVSVSAPYDSEQFSKIEALGCEVYPMRMRPKGTNPFFDLGVMFQYVRLMRKLKPDMSITYTIKPNIYGSWAAAWLRIPFLPVTTGLGYVFLKDSLVTRIAKWLYRLAFTPAHRVWFLNRDDVASFRRARLVADRKVEQLPGEGVDMERFPLCEMPGEEEPFRFLLVARMLRDKGVEEYVEAARQLRRRYPEVHFQLLGAIWLDNPAAIGREHIDEWVAEGVVDYLGVTDDVRPYLRAASCVVLPSYREGVPCTLMEAAATGRPLVATDVPGCHEVVEDGVNGYLCEAKNAESLAAAMERMLKLSTEQRAQMGRAGRRLMEERFDVRLILRQYDEEIDQVLQL